MNNYLYHSNIDFRNTLNRDYIRQSMLSIDSLTDVIVVPYPQENVKIDVENRGGN